MKKITRVVLSFSETEEYVGIRSGNDFYGDVDGVVFKFDITDLAAIEIDGETYICCEALEESFHSVTQDEEQVYFNEIRNIHIG